MLPYLEPLKIRLESAKNIDFAVKMEAYMRNQFLFYGIKAKERQEILKDFLKINGLPSVDALSEILQEMWQQTNREWQYCAMEIFELFIKKNKFDALELAESLILQNSWWDTIDTIAPNIIGKILQYFPEKTAFWVEKWTSSDNMWLNRTSIIFQLHYKQKTNTSLLSECILRHQNSNLFFIQKAIGWALRQYARIDKLFVKNFVEKYNDTLPKLSKREALKHFIKD